MRHPRDREELIDFLVDDEWPFHGRRHVESADVDALSFSGADVETFWIVDGEQTVGLIRLFDLDDIGRGAPQFDLRIARRHRGRGHGTRATAWIVEHLFDMGPEVHRIEATTRDDNTAMQQALTTAGFTLEGRLRASWPCDDGTWFDTMVFGLLRTDRAT
ncbi:MAG: GNAT family protein [Actinomycetota bacterium]